jgi:RNA polymerase sigma-70 factor, ECF subfamily
MTAAIGEEAVSNIPKALDEMYQHHHALVYRAAYRVTGNGPDAEDVLQTVFLRMLRRDASSKEIQNPESYLRRSAVNAALDVVQARREPVALELDRLPGRNPHDQAELRDRLRRALASLPPRQAEIFALRFLEGLSNEEVARATGVSRITVAVTLHRTRRQLQKILREEGA